MDTMRGLRKQLGWSQARLAREWGMAQSNISRMEAGLQKVDARTMQALRALVDAHAPDPPADAA